MKTEFDNLKKDQRYTNFFQLFKFQVILKGQYHELVSNVRYTVVSLTTVHRERCFALSEGFETPPLVMSRKLCYNVSKFCGVRSETAPLIAKCYLLLIWLIIVIGSNCLLGNMGGMFAKIAISQLLIGLFPEFFR